MRNSGSVTANDIFSHENELFSDRHIRFGEILNAPARPRYLTRTFTEENYHV